MDRISKRGVGLVAVMASVAGMSSYACLPDPDTSGLPPRDAGADTTYIPPTLDAGHDVNVVPTDAGDAAPVEASATTGTIVGLVLNYSEGAARGVLPGAVVTVSGSSATTTTDARGAFTLPNLPPGKVTLTIVHATDKIAGIAYSTTQIVVPVLGGQTVDVFPVIHTGCTVTFTPTADATSGMTRTIQAGCASRSGVYASFHIDDATSLQRPGGALYAQRARVEMIPLAFPLGSPTDLSWSIGLPGDLTAAGGAIDPIGGAEIRVVIDADDGSDGTPLQLVPGSRALLQIPVFRQPDDGEALTPWTYSTTAAEWVQDTSANQAVFGTANAYDPQLDTTFTFDVLNVSVDHIYSWWSVGKLRAQTGCVAGTLVAGGAPAAGVLVRGVGVEWLGASSSITDTNGNFCLDGVGSAGTATNMTIVGGYAPSAGSLFTTVTAPKGISAAGHSCAAGASQCAPAGTITMTAVDPSCVTGKVLSNLGDTPIRTKLDLRVEVPSIAPQGPQARAGVNDTAYLGQIQPGSDGTACIPSTPGTTIELNDPSGTACGNAPGSGATVNIPTGLGAGACGGASCVDGGTFRYFCAAP